MRARKLSQEAERLEAELKRAREDAETKARQLREKDKNIEKLEKTMHSSIKGVREDMSNWSKKLDERNQKIKDLEIDRRRLKEQLRRESEKVDKGSLEELAVARE